MRTTVELSEPIYRQLKSEAVDRGMRGFSAIVEEALAEHFSSGGRRELIDAIRAAEGSWSGMDVQGWERDMNEMWATWRIPQS